MANGNFSRSRILNPNFSGASLRLLGSKATEFCNNALYCLGSGLEAEVLAEVYSGTGGGRIGLRGALGDCGYGFKSSPRRRRVDWIWASSVEREKSWIEMGML